VELAGQVRSLASDARIYLIGQVLGIGEALTAAL